MHAVLKRRGLACLVLCVLPVTAACAADNRIDLAGQRTRRGRRAQRGRLMPAEPASPRDHTSTEQHDAPNHDVEVIKEASVMALYVAVCLLAALTAIAENADDSHVRAFAVIWGTTIGLALAHAFAFTLSARLVARGRLHHRDAVLVTSQVVGAALVAVVATIPVVAFSPTAELDAARWALALFICLVGFAVARQSGAGRARAAGYAVAILLVAATIATVKNILSGH